MTLSASIALLYGFSVHDMDAEGVPSQYPRVRSTPGQLDATVIDPERQRIDELSLGIGTAHSSLPFIIERRPLQGRCYPVSPIRKSYRPTATERDPFRVDATMYYHPQVLEKPCKTVATPTRIPVQNRVKPRPHQLEYPCQTV